MRNISADTAQLTGNVPICYFSCFAHRSAISHDETAEDAGFGSNM